MSTSATGLCTNEWPRCEARTGRRWTSGLLCVRVCVWYGRLGRREGGVAYSTHYTTAPIDWQTAKFLRQRHLIHPTAKDRIDNCESYFVELSWEFSHIMTTVTSDSTQTGSSWNGLLIIMLRSWRPLYCCRRPGQQAAVVILPRSPWQCSQPSFTNARLDFE